MKKILSIFVGVVVLIGLLLAFNTYRDMQTAKTVMAQFEPNLMPIKDLASLTKDEKQYYEACLAKKMASNASTKDENAFCRCVASGLAQYVTPLVPSNDNPAVSRAATLMTDASEMGAKGAVIMQVCAENTSR